MKRSHAIATAVLAGLGAVVVPILAALYLTHRQSLQEETRQALTIAQEVRRRADEAGSQSTDAVDQVLAAHDPEPCSDANIALMRRIDMGAIGGDFLTGRAREKSGILRRPRGPTQRVFRSPQLAHCRWAR